MAKAEQRRPNVVVIFSDNHGAWTLGCYGNKEIKTPHIDRLASEGMRFTRAYCCTTVCSPSRATFLTGLIPSQHGVHNYLPTGRGVNIGPDAVCKIKDYENLPQILAGAGYTCGLSGKWHLGDSMRPQIGFTDWFALPEGRPLSGDAKGKNYFHDEKMVLDGELRTQPGYVNDAITDHAVKFIEASRDKPFFLWLAIPPLDFHDCSNRHTDYYAKQTLTSFPKEPVNPASRDNREKIGNQTSMRNYACAVSAVDDTVGRVMQTLARLELDKQTLVVFTCDQGMSGGHHGLWGIGNMYEETLQIPKIYRQPDHIPAGKVCDQLTNAYDFFPTVLDYLQLGEKMPQDPPRPGRSYVPALLGKEAAWENVTFHEYRTARVVRTEQWKYTRQMPDGPHELYDLRKDPGERNNLAGKADYSAVEKDLHKRLEEFFQRYSKQDPSAPPTCRRMAGPRVGQGSVGSVR